MARRAGRHLWRSFKANLVESVVGSRCFSSQNVGKGKQIWEQGISPGQSTSLVTENGAGASSLADWAGITTWKRNLGTGLLGRGPPSCSSTSEGLSILLRSRADAALLVRSAVAMGSRSKQLVNSNFPAAFAQSWSSGLGGARMFHGMALGRPNSSSSCSSVLVRRKVKQSLPGAKHMDLSRRNLSSSGSSWADSWNKTTVQIKKAVGWGPATKAGGGASGTGVKSSIARGGRQSEVLADVTKPLQRTYHRYKEAAGLQLEGFWKRNYLYVVGVVALGVCLVLWRLMYAIASSFISMSEGLAKYGVLALAASLVLVGGVYLRARFTINPDAVYRAAMRKLNTSAAVLEVMGAPLAGTDLRAYIMSGGGFRLKNFRPTLAGKRCFIIFPIRGSERRGLVSIEVKKKKGQYNFKLLAVDIPTAGADQRLFLIGDEKGYAVGGGLIAELRDPIVKAMAALKEFEDTDLAEDEDDARRAAEAAILKVEEEARKAEEAEIQKAEEEARIAAEFETSKEEDEALKELAQKEGMQDEQAKEEDERKKQEQKIPA